MDPSTYSFKKISEKNGISTYYTNPAKGKQSVDEDEIVAFYTKAIESIGNKKWIWIFDGTEFDLKHLFQVEVAIELAKLISSKFSEKLQKIIIINPNFYIKSIYNIIYPFLNVKMKSIVEINYELKSVDELIKS